MGGNPKKNIPHWKGSYLREVNTSVAVKVILTLKIGSHVLRKFLYFISTC